MTFPCGNVLNFIFDNCAREVFPQVSPEPRLSKMLFTTSVELDAATDEEMRMGCHLIVKSLSLPTNCSLTVRDAEGQCLELSQAGERGLRGTWTPPCGNHVVLAHAVTRNNTL
jgi:hypothetical protein